LNGRKIHRKDAETLRKGSGARRRANFPSLRLGAFAVNVLCSQPPDVGGVAGTD
jgi:hypothetical protein